MYLGLIALHVCGFQSGVCLLVCVVSYNGRALQDSSARIVGRSVNFAINLNDNLK